MDDEGCTVDQWLTSAAAAMAFAFEHWQAFADFTEKMIKAPMPIDRGDLLHHAQHIMAMTDPSRMPA